MKNLLGVAFLASIGFTMSLFITELAFDTKLHPEYVPEAKMGIIIASLIGGIVGYLILNTNKEEKKRRRKYLVFSNQFFYKNFT